MGHWRSWLARFHGMEEVKGSNPLCSTTRELTSTPLEFWLTSYAKFSGVLYYSCSYL
jgi:hypothetical protein